MKTTNEIIHDNLSCWDCSFSYKKKKDPNKKWYSEEELIQKIGSLVAFMENKQKDNTIYRMTSEELHNFWLDKLDRLKEHLFTN